MLYIKHIFRSILSRPTQPILMILTMCISICISVTAFGVFNSFTEHNRSKVYNERLLADLVIRVGSDSEERMLFCDDARELLDGRGEVFGDYSITAFTSSKGGKPVPIRAADLEAADRYFDFSFTAYGSFKQDSLHSSAIISKKYADENGISLHDSVSLFLLGQDVTYTVEAIAEDEVYFDGCDILIDISGAVKLLAARSPAIASLGDSFRPSTRLMLKLNEGEDVGNMFSEISEDPRFSDDYVEEIGTSLRTSTVQLMETLSIFMLSFLTVALCFAVILTSMKVINNQRSAEYMLFEISGASNSQTSLLRLSENLFYAFAALIAALSVSPFTVNALLSFFPWHVRIVSLSAAELLFGVCISIVLTLSATAADILRQKKRTCFALLSEDPGQGLDKRPYKLVLLPITLLAVSVLLAIGTYLVPVSNRYIFAVFLIIAELLLLYTSIPFITHAVSSAGEKLLSNSKKHPVLHIALKNIKNSLSHKQLCSLMSVLFAIVITISLSANVISETSDEFADSFSDDIFAYGVSEDVKDGLSKGFEGIGIAEFDFYASAKLESNYSVMVLSVSDQYNTGISGSLLPDPPPKYGEAVISKGISILCDLDKGDTATLSLLGHDYSLTVIGISDAKTNFVYVSSDILKTSNDMYLISPPKDTDRADVIAQLESDGVLTMQSSDLYSSGLQTLSGFVDIAYISLVASMIISAIGLTNMISGQISMRRRERELLRLSGMTTRQTVGMHAIEYAVITLISLIVSVVFSAILFCSVDAAASSFGFVFI